ncbi:tyrosine-protein phosphatase [candidate division KSB1 bacterium]|nr:tyrosine-protein phosphatase [candidate division KSB1 bacterium]
MKNSFIESINNFRDFGGYKTQNGKRIKQGLLYRSASLERESDDDLKKLSALGIQTIIDLRTYKEKQKNPDRSPENSHLKFIHIPIKVKMHNESGFLWQLLSLLFGKARKTNYHEAMKEIYREYITDFRSQFSEIIKLTSESRNLPLLIHCVGGKDRTGFACSLIHLMLDIPVDLVMQDYLQTNDYSHEIKDEIQKRLKKFSFFGISIAKFLPLFEARKEYLEAAFGQIKNDFGAVDDYVREGLNFSGEARQRLKDLLLDK